MPSPRKYYARKKQGKCPVCGAPKQRTAACPFYLCDQCREKNRQNRMRREKKRRQRNLCPTCGGKKSVSCVRCLRCRIKGRKARNEYRERIKNRVFEHYGNACACCGEKERVFLQIDHKKNDGALHRKSVGWRGGHGIYLSIIARHFPASVQILCANCNVGKQLNAGACPHTAAVKQ